VIVGDLEARLRETEEFNCFQRPINRDGPEAADTIASLRAEIERLREEVVSLWHQAPGEKRELHECLGMDKQQYAAWIGATGNPA
jgi:FtsZ-binding cell division protein ZapB